jgi:hypothetical protein
MCTLFSFFFLKSICHAVFSVLVACAYRLYGAYILTEKSKFFMPLYLNIERNLSIYNTTSQQRNLSIFTHALRNIALEEYLYIGIIVVYTCIIYILSEHAQGCVARTFSFLNCRVSVMSYAHAKYYYLYYTKKML